MSLADPSFRFFVTTMQCVAVSDMNVGRESRPEEWRGNDAVIGNYWLPDLALLLILHSGNDRKSDHSIVDAVPIQEEKRRGNREIVTKG